MKIKQGWRYGKRWKRWSKQIWSKHIACIYEILNQQNLNKGILILSRKNGNHEKLPNMNSIAEKKKFRNKYNRLGFREYTNKHN